MTDQPTTPQLRQRIEALERQRFDLCEAAGRYYDAEGHPRTVTDDCVPSAVDAIKWLQTNEGDLRDEVVAIREALEKHRPACDDETLADLAEHVVSDLAKARAGLDAAQELNHDYDSRLVGIRAALNEAGIPEVEPYPETGVDEWERSLRAGGRVIPDAERVARVARLRAVGVDQLANLLRAGGWTVTPPGGEAIEYRAEGTST